MRILTVVIPGVPVPKKRPRTYPVKGGGVRTSTPAATKCYETSVKWWAKRAILEQGDPKGFPLGAPVELLIGAVFFVPTGKGAGRIRPGDFDNYLKAVLDGLEGVVYENDAQVIGCRDVVLVKYRALGSKHKPGAVVEIYETSPATIVDALAAQHKIEEAYKR